MDWYNKYLKYKNKYLNYKYNNKQKGGSQLVTNDDDNIKYFINKIEEDDKFNSLLNDIKKTYTVEFIYLKNCYLIKIIKTHNYNHILFSLAGISTKSFIGTSSVILKNINLLMKKFDIIFLLDYSFYSEAQRLACQQRDIMIENKCECIKANIYNPEHTMNTTIANNIIDIINHLQINNIYLLGKCNGAWVIINMLVNMILNKINVKKFKGVYLGVPGIPIQKDNIIGLDLFANSLDNIYDHIDLKIGLRSDDGYEFLWRKEKFEAESISKIIDFEVELYTKIFGDKKIFYEDTKGEIKDKGNHEITYNFLEKIINI